LRRYFDSKGFNLVNGFQHSIIFMEILMNDKNKQNLTIFTSEFEPITHHHLQLAMSHSTWKRKFREAIVNEETFNLETISKDDCCDLGKWLHHENTTTHVGNLPRYLNCIKKHAEFHIEAGKVAKLANEKKYEEALQLIDYSSAFNNASLAIISEIFPIALGETHRRNSVSFHTCWKTKLRMAMKTNGELPKVGCQAPHFSLVNGELQNVTLATYARKYKILNIVTSFDEPICAASIRTFNQTVTELENTAVLIISADLPFAQHQFCKTEGLHKVITLSSFRSSFADDYGLKIIEGELKGLSARAVIVLDDLDKVIHTQFLSELAHQVNHESIVISIKNAQDSTLIPPPFIEPAIELEYIELNIGNRRDYYRIDTPTLQPIYCQIQLYKPEVGATPQYEEAYNQLQEQWQAEDKELLKNYPELSTPKKIQKTLKPKKNDANPMTSDESLVNIIELQLRDISISGCGILNNSKNKSICLKLHTVYNNCVMLLPNSEIKVSFEIMAKTQLQQKIHSGDFTEIIHVKFIGITPLTESVILHYTQQLERENADVLFIRDDLPSLHQTETQNIPVPNRLILKGNGARRKKIKDGSNWNP